MNERIKELYSEAAVYAFDQRFIPGVVRELQEVITERFAELIVRECAEIADNADATREKWEGIGKYVREHFGVE